MALIEYCWASQFFLQLWVHLAEVRKLIHVSRRTRIILWVWTWVIIIGIIRTWTNIILQVNLNNLLLNLSPLNELFSGCHKLLNIIYPTIKVYYIFPIISIDLISHSEHVMSLLYSQYFFDYLIDAFVLFLFVCILINGESIYHIGQIFVYFKTNNVLNAWLSQFV